MNVCKRIRSHDGRRGHAVVAVLILAMSLTVASAAFVKVSSGVSMRVSQGSEDRAAEYLAEAGIREGIYALNQGSSGNIGSINAPAYLGGGAFWVTATDQADGTVLLEATAVKDGGRAAIQAVVESAVAQDPLFAATMSSRETLTLNSNVMIDSFDSSLGDYASQVASTMDGFNYAEPNGHVASNQDIILNAQAHLFGDATPGPGHQVFDVATGCYVDGSTTPTADPFAFPPIDFPSWSKTGGLSVPGATTVSLGPGDLAYTDLVINKDATLEVTGPATILVDNFTGGKTSNLIIDATNGPVTFYVENTYTHISGFEVDAVAGSEAAVAFLIGGTQDIIFASNTNIRGAYYAPNANLVFTSGNEAWGSFVGNRVDMSNDMHFHYDEALADHWDVDGGTNGGGTVLAWFEATVDSDLLRSQRGDGIDVLGLDADNLASPADAWVAPVEP